MTRSHGGLFLRTLFALFLLGLFCRPVLADADIRTTGLVSSLPVPGGIVQYTFFLENVGSGTQMDNFGDEFVLILPSSLELLDAAAWSGTAAIAAGNAVTWNGTIPGGETVNIFIRARILPGALPGADISVLSTVNFDADLNGTNESVDFDVESVIVANFDDSIFLLPGTKPLKFVVLGNDVSSLGPHLNVTGAGPAQYGTVAANATGSLIYTPTGPIPAGSHDSFGYEVDAGSAGNYAATVTVRSMEAVAATYHGLVVADLVDPTAQNSGLLKVTVTKMGVLTGSLTLGGKKFPLTAKFDVYGVARFGPQATADFVLKRPVPRGQPPLPELRVALHIPPVDALDTIAATITEAGVPLAKAVADRAYFTSKKTPVAPLRNLPPGLAGKYTVAFPLHPAPNQGLDATKFPQGSGYGLLTVAASGVVTVKGKLADGTPVTYSNALSLTKAWPIYVALYKGKGALTGPAQFEPLPASDVAATDLLWFNPGNAKAPRYPDGWSPLFVNLTASLFALPPKGTVASVLPGLGATTPAGNAKFTAEGSNLTALINPVSVNVDPKNKVQFITPPAGLSLKLTIAATGLVTGSFVHPDTRKPVALKGVVLQKLQRIDGFFAVPDRVGALSLVPN